MTQPPLTLLYRYDSERKVYIRCGTHHEISIEKYKAMERQREADALFVLKGVGIGLLAIVAGLIVIL